VSRQIRMMLNKDDLVLIDILYILPLKFLPSFKEIFGFPLFQKSHF
jgi:hypothetical protein